MYFNRKNSQQKNWRMIKKGKHFLFGCALVFAIGASTNVASAETIVSEVTTVDQAQDSTAVSEEADSEAATSTAVSEVASSTSATSEVASETVATSTVATSENSELASTTSEAVTSDNSESASAASSEAASSETASSTTVEAASEVSETVSASETAVANRTAFIGYEVQYTTSTGEVVGKTANIVAADTTEAVATATLTVAATDVPAGYELAAEQAYSLTQQISENQMNILSFAVVKKSEEEEIAESQLANKTVLEQVLSEATLLSEEALRLVATTQAGNATLEAAATATQETADKATLVFEDAAATQEQVDSQVEAVKASTSALADEMLKVDEDGNLTVALNTTGTEISATRGNGTTENVISNYEVRDGYVYWTHEFNNNYVNMNSFNYYFTIPKSVGAMEDLVVTQYNQDGTVRSTSNTWPDGEGSAGAATPNIGTIGNGYFDVRSLSEGSGGAALYTNQNQILAAIDRTNFTGSSEILNNSQENYYVLNSSRRTNRLTRWTVSYRTPIVDENGTLDYIAGASTTTKADNNDAVVGTYGALFKEVPEFYNQQKVDKGQNQNQLNDMLVWRNTEMTTPYQLPIKDNGVAIDEIYYVVADTPATEKITVDNLTISNTGVVTGSASFTGEPKTVEAVIKSGTTLVQSEQAWIVVMDAQGSTINKNEGETVTNQDILDAVTVDWGGYDPTWEFGEAGLTKEVITPTLPTSGQNNVVKVKLTNAQGQEKIVDVIVNWPVNIQAIDQYNITWDNQSVSGRTDEGFELVQDEKGNKVLIYKYDLDNHTAFSMDDVLKQLNATPKDSSSGLRTLDGIEKSKIENNQEGYTTDWNTAKLNGQTIDFLDVVNPDPLWGGRKVVDSTTDSNTKHSTFYIPGTTDIGTASNSVTVGGTNGVDTITVTDNNRNLYSNQVDRQKLYIRSTPASTEDGTNSAVDNDTDTDTIPVYMVGYKNNTPTTGTNKKPLYVFNNTPIATVGAGTDVADNVNKVNVVTLEDPQGINSVEVTRETDVNTTVFNPSSIGITIDTDGNASGTPSVGPIGAYSRGLTVTDGTGAKTNLFPRNNEMETYVLDATAGATITKAVGESVTEAEILDNVTVVTGNSNTMDAAIDSRYRKVLAPDQKVPTTEGTHTVIVRVITESNVYKDVQVTVIIPDSTAPETPSVAANEDGTVTVTPSQTAGDDTKTTDITYTDETGTSQTVTVTKKDDGTWSVPADSGVTVDPTTGAVTIPADKVQDGSTVSATSTDEGGNTSSSATDTAKDNPDTTAPESPSVVANEDGTVTVTPSTTAGDDTKTVDITYTDENGTEQTVTVTKEDDGTWTVPADSGVTVDPTTGAVTIPADKVQDGSTVSATSTDEAGNTSTSATDTAKNNPDTTAPEAPSVVANDNGTVTVTPSTTAGDDTKTVDITYTDENGTEQTVTVTKEDDGTWSVPADSGVTVDPTTGAVTIPADKVQDGSTVSATSTDEAGNTSSPATDTAKNNPDTTAPAAPAIETDLTGKAGTTDPIKVTGAEPGSTVTLKDPAGNVIGTGTANDNGEVEITPTTPLPEGSITATSTDKAGNESDPSAPKEATPADKTAPAAPAIETDLTGKAGTTDPIKVTGAEPGSTVTLKDPAGNVIGTGTANDNGEVEITPTTPLPEGSITATSTDKAGNESEASEPKVATTPDTTAPEAPTIETDLTGKAGTTDPVKVTGAEPGSTVTLKDKDGNVIGTGTADENGVATITPTTPLPEGQVTATSTDEAGNESEASEPKVATTPDTTAPEAPTIETDLTGKAGTTDPVKVTGA
ncbi:Ig-like domain-containing protein, partial [Streptococcus suis]